MLGRLLLKEHLAVDPVRIPLHRERPVFQVRDNRVRNRAVVLEEVALRDPVLGVEDAVGAAQLDGLRLGHCRGTDISRGLDRWIRVWSTGLVK